MEYLFSIFPQIEYELRDLESPSNSQPASLEEFLVTLKKRWVKCTTYTRNEKIKVPFSTIPPVIVPAMKGAQVINTEAQKRSIFLKQHGKPSEGFLIFIH